jgi:hypothetical protein
MFKDLKILIYFEKKEGERSVTFLIKYNFYLKHHHKVNRFWFNLLVKIISKILRAYDWPKSLNDVYYENLSLFKNKSDNSQKIQKMSL